MIHLRARTASLLFGGSLAVLSLAAGACSDSGFGTQRGTRHLVVELVKPPSNPGAIDKPLTLSVNTPVTFRLHVKAILPDGSQDAGFTSYVRLSSKPGAIPPINSGDADGRNVLLHNGLSDDIDVQVGSAFGVTYIVADDLGYVPADPLRQPPPQCADGIDNDGNGLVDFPADPGCAFPNDDSELGGTYEEGVSEPIFFQLPRIADARGLQCDPVNGCAGGGATPFPKDQLLLDMGYHDLPSKKHPDGPGFDFDAVVVRIAADGFYVTDVSDGFRPPQPAGSPLYTGYNSLYAYNFNAPPGMRVCDRIKSLAGTASEFFGFTQLSYPTWTLEPWDPNARSCLVPEPMSLGPAQVLDKDFLLRASASLVRVETLHDQSIVATIGAKLGPGDVPHTGATFTPAADATNCDYNHDGKIDFSPGSDEGNCSTACTADLDCIEYSNFKSRSQFRIIVKDKGGQIGALQADASAAAGFDVLSLRGQSIRSFSGTLTYFSGGSQYTIEARCEDDIILDTTKDPIPPDFACVRPRSPEELNPQ